MHFDSGKVVETRMRLVPFESKLKDAMQGCRPQETQPGLIDASFTARLPDKIDL